MGHIAKPRCEAVDPRINRGQIFYVRCRKRKIKATSLCKVHWASDRGLTIHDMEDPNGNR